MEPRWKVSFECSLFLSVTNSSNSNMVTLRYIYIEGAQGSFATSLGPASTRVVTTRASPSLLLWRFHSRFRFKTSGFLPFSSFRCLLNMCQDKRKIIAYLWYAIALISVAYVVGTPFGRR